MTPESLKHRRLGLGLTQQGFARQVGVAQSTVSKFEAGTRKPAYDALERITDGLQDLERHSSKTVADVMNPHIVDVPPHGTIADAKAIFKRHGYSQVPVLDGAHVKGMVTTKGLLDVEDDTAPVQDHLEPGPPCVPRTASVESVKPLLKEFPMVLVTDQGKLIGIVTRHDVL